MSCWVVPAVAAEYWGVPLDAVWNRIHDNLVPCKTEQGFVFIDVDPWRFEPNVAPFHEPPPTFIPAAEDPAAALALADDLNSEDLNGEELNDDDLNGDERDFLSDDLDLPTDEDDSFDSEEESELPELDEEESATFGRLSWEEVRRTVSRTRRPPPAAMR